MLPERLSRETRNKVYKLVRAAIKRGDLVIRENCELCGTNPGHAENGMRLIQAHHYAGYDKPLTVQWLCPPCHRDIDDRTLDERIEDGAEWEPNTGCHLWSGDTDPGEYPRLMMHKKKFSPHRESLRKRLGMSVLIGTVRRTCDQRRCINADHLLLIPPRHKTTFRNLKAEGA